LSKTLLQKYYACVPEARVMHRYDASETYDLTPKTT